MKRNLGGEKIAQLNPSRQLCFLPKQSMQFGGSLSKGKRKSKRPVTTKNPIHFVLKSEKAKRNLSFVNHKSSLEKIIAQVCKVHHIKLYEMAINFDHIHLVIRLPNVSAYAGWIKALTSLIVQTIARRAKQAIKNFFTLRPYSRIITWGRQFKRVLEYQILNQMEIFGLRPGKQKHKLTALDSFQMKSVMT